MKQVWQMIEEKELLVPGDYVLIGVSGGPDSVALLHLLWQYSKGKNIQLHIVHLNHQLRGNVADEETMYVQALAKQLDLPCSIFTASAAEYARKNGLSLEQAGHELRFQYFRQVAEQTGATKLALGHHSGDKVETLLLNLLRGCGPEGLTAMPMQEGWIIRPLLLKEKAELIAYCQEYKLTYYIDGSNAEADCLRNKVRLELLPLLEQEYNSQVKKHLLQLAEISEDEQTQLEKITNQLWRDYGTRTEDKVTFPLEVFRAQTKAIQRRLLRMAYVELKGDNHGLSYRLLEDMRSCAWTDNGEKWLALASGMSFSKSYHELCWHLKPQNKTQMSDYTYIWSREQELSIEEIGCVFSWQKEREISPKNEKMWSVEVDKACLPEKLTIRTRRAGDYLRLRGMSGRKKLKEFMIDRKIPASERNSLPLIVDGEEIIWIPGYFLAERVRITETTSAKIYLTCKKIDN